MSTSDQGSL